MTIDRSQLLGLCAIGSGFVLILMDISELSPFSEYSYLVLIIVAVLAIFGGTIALGGYWMPDGDWWQPTPTEGAYRVQKPGETYTELATSPLQSRFRKRVIASLMSERNYSQSVAKDHAASGTWTDDQIAASYVGDGPLHIPLTAKISGMVRRESSEDQAIRHTVAALRTVRSEGMG